MVATVKRSRKSTSSRKTPDSQPIMKSGKFRVLCIAAFFLFVIFGYILYQLKSIKVDRAKPTKQTQVVSKPQPPKIESTYNYTEILESKEVDSGSGVTVTRNYEAEKIAKEHAYYQELAEKRRKIQEAKQKAEQERLALAAEKRRLAEERRILAEQKRLLAEQKRTGVNSGSSSITSGKILSSQQSMQSGKKYINCSSDNFRTIKEAEAKKAKLAFTGRESQVIFKQMGGGTVYTLNIGPFNTMQEAIDARNSLLKSKAAQNCSIL